MRKRILFYQKGGSNVENFIIFTFIMFGIFIFISEVGNPVKYILGGESEGTVKYDDCRQIITIQDNSWQTYIKPFICTYSKTKSGKIMSGECVHTDNDSALFSSSHTCATAYVYKKNQEGVCTDPKYPYLLYDDMCHAEPFYTAP